MSGEETNGEGGQECAHQDEAVLDGGSGVSGGGNGVGPVVGMLAQTVAGLKARSPLTSAAHKLPGKVCHASDLEQTLAIEAWPEAEFTPTFRACEPTFHGQVCDVGRGACDFWSANA